MSPDELLPISQEGQLVYTTWRFRAEFVSRSCSQPVSERLAERADFRTLDATAPLPFPDASFDAVVSTFGVMFTPNQDRAASELVRVCKRRIPVGENLPPPLRIVPSPGTPGEG